MGDLSTEKKTVVVTGFGPFSGHDVNASWCAVKQLAELGLGDDVKLVTLEIPVVYDTVSTQIPQLWKTYRPHLMVHVGVSGVAHELTLEQRAINTGYTKFDIESKLPTKGCCVPDSVDCIVSDLDMSTICSAVNESDSGIFSVVSHDPGRYLCEFVYYTSLNIDKSRTAFIHVPCLNDPYSGIELAKGLQLAIQGMLKQLS